jgi:CDP-diacylglycerol--glycerol-3-phosphate 3-phosphatidyltransferase
MWINVPNCITCVRIIGALVLLWLKPLSTEFLIVYSLCGVSDALDGFIARATNTTSKFGTILDSIADLVFYSVMLLKVFPTLWDILPMWVWIMTGVAIAIRLSSYAVAACKYKRFASQHTYFNKLSGLCMFLVPYMLKLPINVGYCVAVCIVAGLASLEELLIHITEKEYIPDQKSLFFKSKKSAH